MSSTRRRNDLLSRRRRTGDDGEDDASVASDTIGDSQSEASLPSDVDEGDDADNSDMSGTDPPGSTSHKSPKAKRNNRRKVKGKAVKSDNQTVESASAEPTFSAMQDTETMMNGLSMSDKRPEEASLDFDTLGKRPTTTQPLVISSDANDRGNRPQETIVDRRKREQEEYKQKRDADPAFIPNRGAFFMHDHRSAGPGQNGFRPFGRGRGRGRGSIGGPFSPANIAAQSTELTSTPWKHDLHDSLTVPEDKHRPQPAPYMGGNTANTQLHNKPAAFLGHPPAAQMRNMHAAANAAPVRSFDMTRPLATANVRVYIHGMKEPKISTVEIKTYAKLPNHRPPLRRDKPVRVSLPYRPPQYIFPATERSFIFIPRALRPNQTAPTRGRPRGAGSITGFSSRRTSMYGGSMISPSAAASRRSSIVREFNREALLSPAGSIMAGRPVVRMPYGSQQHTPSHSSFASGAGPPITYGPQPSYALPQKPHHQESLPPNMHMHQPRPQKQYSVAGIESPHGAQILEQQEQQAFHQQVPLPTNGQAAQAPIFYPGPAQVHVAPQAIPQAAILAPSFQPYSQPAYQHMPNTQPMYFYPPSNQTQYMGPPMYMPNQEYDPRNMLDPSVQAQSADPGQMMAYEQNGMVYYYDPGQMQQPGEGYAMQGMGGTMTPAPDGYYYPQMGQGGAVYYPS